MSGHFGMVSEPVIMSVASPSWMLSGSSLMANIGSGYVKFSPRNQHNQSFSQHTVEYPLPPSVHHIKRILSHPLVFASGDVNTHHGDYVVRVNDSYRSLHGTGNTEHLTLSGTMLGRDVVVSYDDSERIYTFDTYRVYVSVGKKIVVRHHSQESRQADIDCRFSSDMFLGKCTIQPPVGDAFIRQLPLTLSWTVHLASNKPNVISD